jgi:hypothetical protein
MILRGLWLLARGKAAGLKEFGASGEALLAALAPLIAFPLVGAAVTAFNGEALLALAAFVVRLCGVLALPVVIYECARLARREGEWLRTATALSWGFWVIVPLLFVAAVAGAVLVAAGLPMAQAETAALALLGLYLLWFQWFVVRAGLRLGKVAALGVVAANAIVTVLCTGAAVLAEQAHR